MRIKYWHKKWQRTSKPHAVFIDFNSAFDNVNWNRII